MNLFRETTLRAIAQILLVSYIGFLSLGFTHIIHMSSIDGHMTDCPFEYLIPNHTHTGAQDIQTVVTTILITVLSYLGSVTIVRTFSVLKDRQLYDQATIFSIVVHQKQLTPHLFLYQFLFSQGILHPKPF